MTKPNQLDVDRVVPKCEDQSHPRGSSRGRGPTPKARGSETDPGEKRPLYGAVILIVGQLGRLPQLPQNIARISYTDLTVSLSTRLIHFLPSVWPATLGRISARGIDADMNRHKRQLTSKMVKSSVSVEAATPRELAQFLLLRYDSRDPGPSCPFPNRKRYTDKLKTRQGTSDQEVEGRINQRGVERCLCSWERYYAADTLEKPTQTRLLKGVR